MSAERARVLVTDDDDGIRTTAAAILRAKGYEVIEASDGDVALEKLGQTEFDVLVLDIRMPKLDGISVLEALEDPPVVLLVSAFSMDDDIRSRTSGKVFKYLRKPVAPGQLIEAVSEAMNVAKGRSVARSGDR